MRNAPALAEIRTRCPAYSTVIILRYAVRCIDYSSVVMNYELERIQKETVALYYGQTQIGGNHQRPCPRAGLQPRT